jgi:hypothetical protein
VNKRIQELAKEHFCRVEFDNGSVHECYEFSPAELEKFAELIIRECIAVHEDDYGVDIIGDVLKKHFGLDSEDKVEYCPRCNAEWSGTSCGLDNCGWIVGVEE